MLEPRYPKEVPVADAKLNETLSHALTAKEAEQRLAESGDKPRGSARSFVRGAAVGVGSAALVAALLYANSRRSGSDKSKREEVKPPLLPAPAPARPDEAAE